MKIKEVSDKQINRRTWISWAVFVLGGAAMYKGWKWIHHAPAEQGGATAGLPQPARDVLNENEKIIRGLYSPKRLARTYPQSMAATNVRYNSNIGMKAAPDLTWRLNIKKADGSTLSLSLDDIKALPKTSFAFDFKCVEGWDQISHWGGLLFSDLMVHYGLVAEARMGYVGMETPDKEYYVGIDMPSALHPQTLLAYEVNNSPLPAGHGAPLRLIIPLKYGIKNLKRIGNIFFSDTRPRDYWAERGYDYYAGL
jgi:DMSO/TMAO reductase YedYZ molybdopterin-dependent catalytic subunit